MNEHEEMFVKAFVVTQKRERFVEQLASTKHRRGLTSSLDHSRDLEDRLASRIARDEQTDGIYSILANKGAPDTCHVISSNAELDGKDMSLLTALQEVVGYGDGTFLSCVPGKLGYFESGEPGERFIFETK